MSRLILKRNSSEAYVTCHLYDLFSYTPPNRVLNETYGSVRDRIAKYDETIRSHEKNNDFSFNQSSLQRNPRPLLNSTGYSINDQSKLTDLSAISASDLSDNEGTTLRDHTQFENNPSSESEKSAINVLRLVLIELD